MRHGTTTKTREGEVRYRSFLQYLKCAASARAQQHTESLRHLFDVFQQRCAARRGKTLLNCGPARLKKRKLVDDIQPSHVTMTYPVLNKPKEVIAAVNFFGTYFFLHLCFSFFILLHFCCLDHFYLLSSFIVISIFRVFSCSIGIFYLGLVPIRLFSISMLSSLYFCTCWPGKKEKGTPVYLVGRTMPIPLFGGDCLACPILQV